MAENTAIEWCDHTFNPWIGCTEVSKADAGGGGCDGCYAKVSTPVRVLRSKGIETWGPGAQRVRTQTWGDPVKWDKRHYAFYARHWRRQRVFCASLADVFDNEVPGEWRQQLMTLVADTPNLDWLFLTKRIGNARKMLADASMHDGRLLTCNDQYKAPANLWIGATVVNQQEADRDIPKLLATPAAVRFLSIEPMLGPICLTELQGPGADRAWVDALRGTAASMGGSGIPYTVPKIDWVIAGGESGPGARPMHPDWVRSLRDQCGAAGVPFLFKQWGEWWEVDSDSRDEETGDHHQIDTRDPEAREMWDPKTDCLMTVDGRRFTPETLPEDTPGRLMTRLGKKAAGRRLDGVEHNGYPGAA